MQIYTLVKSSSFLHIGDPSNILTTDMSRVAHNTTKQYFYAVAMLCKIKFHAPMEDSLC